MKRTGRISDWNDNKGYGFIIPQSGGSRVFIHIKAFQLGSRRPVNGDLILYSVSKDNRGRINAIDVRFAGQKAEKQKQPIPRIAIGFIFIFLVIGCTALGILPASIAIGYISFSLISYTLYRLDKAAAVKGMPRTPENTLHFFDLIGGWPGALVAQQQSRHKTKKASFQLVFWFTVIANLVAAAWLVHSGYAHTIKASMLVG